MPGPVLDLLLRPLHVWGIEAVFNRPDVVVDHVSDPVGVVNYDLVGLLVPQETECLQHLVGRPEVDVGTVGPIQRVGTPLGVDQDLPVNPVVLIEVMDIPGGNHRLIQVITQLDHVLQDVLQVGLIRDHVLLQKWGVVGLRLDLDKVVVAGLLQGRGVPLLHHRREYLPGRAGRSQQEPFTILGEQGPWNPWDPVEVPDVGVRDQLEKVLQASLGLGQQGDMKGPGVLVGIVFGHVLIEVVNVTDVVAFFGVLQELIEQVASGLGIVVGPVVMLQGDLELLTQGVQPVTPQVRVEKAGQGEGINDRFGDLLHPMAPVAGVHEAHIEGDVMPGNDTAVAEVLEHLEDLFLALGPVDHLIGDASQLSGLFRQWEARINEFIETLQDVTILHLNCRELDHLVIDRRQPGGFHVEDYVGVIQQDVVVLVVDQRNPVIDHVSLHPVEHLDTKLVGRLEGLRKGLNVAVVGNRQCRLSPLVSALGQLGDRVGGIHLTHLGVGMKLNPLVIGRRLVLPVSVLNLVDIVGVDHQVMHPGIFLDRPPDLQPDSGLDVSKLGLILGIAGELLDRKRGGVISNLKGQELAPRT